MEYVIYLTDNCNLSCNYCYQNKEKKDIKFEYIKSLIDYEITQKNKYSIINFYGGEPLLKKDLIKATINYIKSAKTKTKFYYGITTNGTLLDDDFIKYMKKNNFVNIGYSFDGMKRTHDLNRLTIDGKETFDIVFNNSKKIINKFPRVVATLVICKNTLKNLAENVEFLYKIGFKHINLLFDYFQNWTDKDLPEIKKQYSNIAQIYTNKILSNKDFNISLIDDKIQSYIKEDYNCNENCKMGIKLIILGTDGNLYPCMQFVKNKKFIIGNCENGIDFNARANLVKNSRKEDMLCKKCSINKRCNHTCSCKNYILTKDINKLSPIICEIEKILIEVSDNMAEIVYNKNPKLFIKKYYK